MFTRLIAFAMVLAVSTFVAAQEQSAAQLVGCVKNFSSADPKCEPFSFCLAFATPNSEIGMQLNCCWRGDDHYSILVSESRSRCPLALFVDGQFLFLDVVTGRVLRGSGLTPSVTFRSEDGDDKDKLVVGLALAMEKKAAVKLDLRTLLPKKEDNLQVSALPDQICMYDREDPVRFAFTKNEAPEMLSVQVNDDHRVLAEVTGLKTNGKAEYIEFPRLEGLGLTIDEFDHQNSTAAMLEVYTHVLRSVAGVAAVSNTECRRLSIFPKDIDWEQVRQRREVILTAVAARLNVKQVGAQ